MLVHNVDVMWANFQTSDTVHMSEVIAVLQCKKPDMLHEQNT